MKILLCSALFLSAGVCPASTLLLNSSAGETLNSTAQATVNILHDNPAWGAPLGASQWVSYTQSDTAGVVPARKSVTFFDYFTASSAADTGFVNVEADYTSSVKLNGVLLKGFPSIGHGDCSPVAIGCTAATEAHITLSGFQAGLNVLSFTVEDGSFGPASAGGPQPNWNVPTPFGLDYSGEVDSDVGVATHGAVPEPSYLLLLGAPLLAFALWRRKATV